jgi:hypothetical protein
MSHVLVQPTFRTARLSVFRADIRPTEDHSFRAVFLGFLVEGDIPCPAVTATVFIHGPYNGHTLDMIHTLDAGRRTGLATELWLGIEEYLGGHLYADAKSDEGEALLAAVRRARGPSVHDRRDFDNLEKQEEIKEAYLQQRALEKQWVNNDQQNREIE